MNTCRVAHSWSTRRCTFCSVGKFDYNKDREGEEGEVSGNAGTTEAGMLAVPCLLLPGAMRRWLLLFTALRSA